MKKTLTQNLKYSLVKNVEHIDFRAESFAIIALESVDNLDKAISQIYRVFRLEAICLCAA